MTWGGLCVDVLVRVGKAVKEIGFYGDGDLAAGRRDWSHGVGFS